MLESIRGRLLAKTPTRAIVEAGGVGYAVQLTVADHDALPAPGAEVRLLVHLEVSADSWKLFGFLDASDREVFRALRKVNKVGPERGLAILSGIGAEDLVAAIAAGDVSGLKRVKGIGPKLAERIVLELRDAVKDGLLGAGRGPGRPAAPTGPAADAVQALVTLGIDAPEARRRIDLQRAKLGDDADVSALVRAALRS